MATKLKKFRILLCGLSFFLGLSILLGIAALWLQPAQILPQQVRWAYNLSRQSDYQNTDYFKHELLSDLTMLLDKAADYNETETYFQIAAPGGEQAAEKKMEIRRSPEIQSLVSGDKYLYELFSGENLIAYNSAEISLKKLDQDGAFAYDTYNPSSSLASSMEEKMQAGTEQRNLALEKYNLFLTIKDGEVRIWKNNAELSLNYLYGYNSEDLLNTLASNVDRNSFFGITKISLYLAVPRTPADGSPAYQNFLFAKGNATHFMVCFLAVLTAGILLFLVPLFFRKNLRYAARAIAVFCKKCSWKLQAGIAAFTVIIAAFFLWKSSYNPSMFAVSFLILFWTLYLAFSNFWITKKLSLKPAAWFGELSKALQEKQRRQALQKRVSAKLFWFLLTEIILFSVFLYFAYVLKNDYSPLWPPFLVYLALAIIPAYLFALPYFRRFHLASGELQQIFDQIHKIRGGDYSSPLGLPEQSAFKNVEKELNDLQAGMSAAVEEQVHAERMKVDLIANVSHDIKTPLTSIISYVDLLQKEEGLAPQVQDYIKILAAKSERLKLMVQDVFELSKATSGNMQLYPEILDLGKLIRQTLADMDEEVTASSLVFRVILPEEPVTILADGSRLYRVYQNLIKNVLQYSLEHSRVYIELAVEGKQAAVSIKNISKQELSNLHEDILERFVRGDASRTTEGSGLGLSIAKTFTEACGGVFQLSTDADLFAVTTGFPVIPPAPNPSSDVL